MPTRFGNVVVVVVSASSAMLQVVFVTSSVAQAVPLNGRTLLQGVPAAPLHFARRLAMSRSSLSSHQPLGAYDDNVVDSAQGPALGVENQAQDKDWERHRPGGFAVGRHVSKPEPRAGSKNRAGMHPDVIANSRHRLGSASPHDIMPLTDGPALSASSVANVVARTGFSDVLRVGALRAHGAEQAVPAWREPETMRLALVNAVKRLSGATFERASDVAPGSLGVLLVFALVGIFWTVEFFFTTRTGHHVQEQSIDSNKYESKRFLVALNFARYLMSWHVVINNFLPPFSHNEGVASGSAWVLFARWGIVAVPWFFLVSGFAHTYAKLVGPEADRVEDWFYGMVRRAASWYPLFLLGLGWCAAQSSSLEAQDWAEFTASVFLIHGLVWEHTGFPFALSDWWLSFLVIYLIAFSPMYQAVKSATNSALWTLLFLAVVVSVPIAIFDWMWEFRMPLWTAITYWPSFVFGQALAAWFVNHCMLSQSTAASGRIYTLRAARDIPLLARFGTTLSMLCMGILFFICSPTEDLPLIRVPITSLVLKGGLLPALGLFTVGLACEVDPISKLFKRVPFFSTEKLALANFVLQVPVHNALKGVTGWDGCSWTFMALLLIASIFCHVLIDKPWRQFLRLRAK